MSWNSSPPLIWDFDQSVKRLSSDEIRLDFGSWQEQLRFGCSRAVLARFEQSLELPPNPGCLFLGSGDFHHLSLLPLKKLAASEGPLDVVVCDNHPDNMRYPFGIHCGSWVRWAVALPGLRHIHVIGISSADVSWLHAWENNWLPLISGKLTYWCHGRKAGWLKFLGRAESCRSFESPDDLICAFRREAAGMDKAYLSIDKDVLSPATVTTNWDQGQWEKRHLAGVIESLGGRLAGVDVTGEASAYEYGSLFKRLLTHLDSLEKADLSKLAQWQAEQQSLNMEILALLKKAGH